MSSPKIVAVRPVLLSAPYAHPEKNLEVRYHVRSGWRTCGMVEIALDNDVRGLGEGYLAVFAPHVFRSIVELVAPILIGRPIDDVGGLVRDLLLTTGYWSLQGAAQHVVSALEIALLDAQARTRGVPVYALLGGAPRRPLDAYASGGDSLTPGFMAEEFDEIEKLGITLFKIRARRHQAAKAIWCQRRGARSGVRIAVDMTQNLAIPSQTVDDVVAFVRAVEEGGGARPFFLEEALGPQELGNYRALRRRLGTRVAGGEIVTTAAELCARLEAGCYDIAQPDATVIGGIRAVLDVCATADRCGAEVYVHCWGGPVGMMANYHAAIAGGGSTVEWPLPRFPLREALVEQPWVLRDGQITLPDTPGLGVRLTPEIERDFAFREDAVYHCRVDPALLAPEADWS